MVWILVVDLAYAVLAAEILFVAARSRRQLGLAVWVALLLVYAVTYLFVLTPVLANVPRPARGGYRVLIHLGQLLYMAPTVTFGVAFAHLIAGPRWMARAAIGAGAVAFALFVIGYGRGPAASLYRIGPAVFRSQTVYLTLAVTLDAMVAAVVAPRYREILDDLKGTDERTAFFAALALAGGGLIDSFAQATTHLSRNGSFAITMMSSAMAIGLYAPLVYAHAFRADTKEFQKRLRLSRRRYAIFEMGERVTKSRAAFAALGLAEVPALSDFPTAGPLARRASLGDELLRTAARSARKASAVDLVLAVAWSTGPAQALELIDEGRRVVEAIRDERDDATSPISLQDVLESDVVERYDRLYAPLLHSLVGMVRGLTPGDALEVIGTAGRIAEAAGSKARRW